MDGRLFGSVTNVDVVDALKAQGIEVEKAMIRMPEGPLKHVGEFALTVAPHTDVVAHITVTVIGERARADAEPTSSTASRAAPASARPFLSLVRLSARVAGRSKMQASRAVAPCPTIPNSTR